MVLCLACAELAEILRSLRDYICEEFEFDTPKRLSWIPCQFYGPRSNFWALNHVIENHMEKFFNMAK
jgi:hypothetical protein